MNKGEISSHEKVETIEAGGENFCLSTNLRNTYCFAILRHTHLNSHIARNLHPKPVVIADLADKIDIIDYVETGSDHACLKSRSGKILCAPSRDNEAPAPIVVPAVANLTSIDSECLMADGDANTISSYNEVTNSQMISDFDPSNYFVIFGYPTITSLANIGLNNLTDNTNGVRLNNPTTGTSNYQQFRFDLIAMANGFDANHLYRFGADIKINTLGYFVLFLDNPSIRRIEFSNGAITPYNFELVNQSITKISFDTNTVQRVRYVKEPGTNLMQICVNGKYIATYNFYNTKDYSIGYSSVTNLRFHLSSGQADIDNVFIEKRAVKFAE
ncbi:MAG: hypothetical protein A2Z20_06075 [Bdellovibrionales bacterium RBG_16_40_8]|nr:MAG: hypothetical protein A2Z20_06075 [Bdellovibrionales bacterium RBG_16_40_8]